MNVKYFKHALQTAIPIVASFIYSPVFAQTNGDENSFTVDPKGKDVEWAPAPEFFPGCTFTIVHGDLSEPNMDFLFKIEPNTEVVSHTHNSAERMILIQGNLEVQYEGEDKTVLTPGMYAYGPPNKPHKAKCLDGDECILFVALVEPFNAEPTAKD